MSADTEEVTPPPDVTLGEEPQSEVQSLITLRCNESMDPTRPRSTGDMRSVSMMSPPSFKEQPIRRLCQTVHNVQSVESTERFGASMRIRSMEPKFSFRSAGNMRSGVYGLAFMMSPPSFSGQPIRRSPLTVHNFQSVESPECYGLSMMRSDRSMEPKFSFRVPGQIYLSLPEPDFPADSSVKRLPLGYIEPPPSFKPEPIPEWSYRPAPGCYMEPWMSPCNRTMGILVN